MYDNGIAHIHRLRERTLSVLFDMNTGDRVDRQYYFMRLFIIDHFANSS